MQIYHLLPTVLRLWPTNPEELLQTQWLLVFSPKVLWKNFFGFEFGSFTALWTDGEVHMNFLGISWNVGNVKNKTKQNKLFKVMSECLEAESTNTHSNTWCHLSWQVINETSHHDELEWKERNTSGAETKGSFTSNTKWKQLSSSVQNVSSLKYPF